MVIEKDQALFKGENYYFPDEIWSVKDQKFKPYTGKLPMPDNWGDIITEAEAEEWKKPVVSVGS